MPSRQFMLTPAMGKRIIGKALLHHPHVQAVLGKGRLVVVACTTNGYVAEEILRQTNQADGFSRVGFRRGLVSPSPPADAGVKFPGDVVLVDGKWQGGKTIFDVCDDLQAGDLILKGANALNLSTGQAGVYIEHPQGGTCAAVIRAVVGRRVRLIVPVGLEKRVEDDIFNISMVLNDPESAGPRMLALPGRAFTELDAIEILTGAKARLVAGGGVHGAEGCVWVLVKGTVDQLDRSARLVESLVGEPPCRA